MLSHVLFRNSTRLSSFLRYIVEETVAGRGAAIKEYTIGERIYQRGAAYDPKADAIVRVEAARLRGKLKQYYSGPGLEDAIRIDLPSGTYVPVFTERCVSNPAPAAETATARPGGLRRWAAAVLVAALAAAAAWRLAHQSDAIFTVTVLPIANLTGDAGQDFHAAALTDQVAARLSDMPGIRVERVGSARASAAAFRAGDPPSAAATLSGSLQSADGERRLVVHVDDQAGVQVWSKTLYSSRQTAGQFEDMATALIARTLERRFGGKPVGASPEPLPRNQAAAGLFSRGQREWETQTHDGVTNSVRLFRQAVERDPGYAAAWAQRGAATLFLAYLEPAQTVKWHAEARSALEKALELNDRNDEAHIRLGNIYLEYDWDFSAAERELGFGIELNPGEAARTRWFAMAAEIRGHTDAARRELQYALVLSPGSELLLGELARLELRAGRTAEAEELARAAISAAPNYGPSHFAMALVQEEKGDRAAARSEYEACAAARAWPFDCTASLARLNGDGKLEQFPRHYSRAMLQMAAGRNDAALGEIREGLLTHEHFLPYVCLDPQFRRLFGSSPDRPCVEMQRWIAPSK